jgi:hypothetical protein
MRIVSLQRIDLTVAAGTSIVVPVSTYDPARTIVTWSVRTTRTAPSEGMFLIQKASPTTLLVERTADPGANLANITVTLMQLDARTSVQDLVVTTVGGQESIPISMVAERASWVVPLGGVSIAGDVDNGAENNAAWRISSPTTVELYQYANPCVRRVSAQVVQQADAIVQGFQSFGTVNVLLPVSSVLRSASLVFASCAADAASWLNTEHFNVTLDNDVTVTLARSSQVGTVVRVYGYVVWFDSRVVVSRGSNNLNAGVSTVNAAVASSDMARSLYLVGGARDQGGNGMFSTDGTANPPSNLIQIRPNTAIQIALTRSATTGVVTIPWMVATFPSSEAEDNQLFPMVV